MIPRLKPFLGWQEALSIFKRKDNAVARFEAVFADKFGSKHAIAFSYGRSALWAFLNAMGLIGIEVVQPAYTCSVVAHATVLSGNIPVFVDCNLSDYNMDLNKFAEAITANTRVVIPTHIFGYPMDVNAVSTIVNSAEEKYGHKIWIIQDCAHSFGAAFNDIPVVNAGDGALFGLGISKLITSVFGGMFTTDDDELAGKLRTYRNKTFNQAGFSKTIKRYLYLLAVYPAFADILYGLVYWLQEKTPFLNNLTKAYHLDNKIHFPPDYLDQMTHIEALVGIAQLEKYDAIIKQRQLTAEQYFRIDTKDPAYHFLPKVSGATYSHFAIRTENKTGAMAFFAAHGVQLGELIEYSMPHHPEYQQYTKGLDFPNALLCSRSMINLPIHPGLKPRDITRIISTFKAYTRNGN